MRRRKGAKGETGMQSPNTDRHRWSAVAGWLLLSLACSFWLPGIRAFVLYWAVVLNMQSAFQRTGVLAKDKHQQAQLACSAEHLCQRKERRKWSTEVEHLRQCGLTPKDSWGKLSIYIYIFKPRVTADCSISHKSTQIVIIHKIINAFYIV